MNLIETVRKYFQLLYEINNKEYPILILNIILNFFTLTIPITFSYDNSFKSQSQKKQHSSVKIIGFHR
jgi:hypothetical protein